MEEVINFLNAFIREEYETLITLQAEYPISVLEAKCSNLNSFFSNNLEPELYRLNSYNLKEGTPEIFQPRILFQVKQYNHPIYSKLYRAYMSSVWHGDTSYFTSFFVSFEGSKLKIVSQYNVCVDCNGSGTQGSKTCEECSGFGWNWRGGFQLDTFGKEYKTYKLKMPNNSVHLEDYESG